MRIAGFRTIRFVGEAATPILRSTPTKGNSLIDKKIRMLVKSWFTKKKTGSGF
jgi:hypothetical protein